MINKYGVEARDGAVIVMRMSAGQRLDREDLANLVAHLVVHGDMTAEDVATACAELEDAPAKPAPPPPPPAPAIVPPPAKVAPKSRRAAAADASASLKPGASGNGKD